MAVITNTNVQYRQFNGYSDPRYPQGMWFGASTSVGDATGGVNEAVLVFTLSTITALGSRIFNMEQFSVRSSRDADADIRFSHINLTGPQPPGLQHYSLALVSDAISSSASVSARDMRTLVPLFLGSQRLQGVTAGIAIDNANNDTEIMVFEAQGYWWGPRSVMADGGPQRPPTGMYGTG